MDPNGGGNLGIVTAQLFSQVEDQLLDSGKGLPGIGKAHQIGACNAVGKVKKVFCLQHGVFLLSAEETAYRYYTPERTPLSILF